MYTNVLYLTNNQFEYGTMMHCWGVVLPNIKSGLICWEPLHETFGFYHQACKRLRNNPNRNSAPLMLLSFSKHKMEETPSIHTWWLVSLNINYIPGSKWDK